MRCANCNTEVAEGTKFCPECGNRIELPQPLKCPQCDTVVAEGVKFCSECGSPITEPKPTTCSKCGTKIEAGERFCSNCGNPMISQQQSQQSQYQQPYQSQYQQPYQGQYQQPYQGQYQSAYRQQQPQRPQNPRLNFVDAISLASSRLTETDGRSRRSEFWWWFLVIAIGTGILSIIPYVGAFSQLISLGLLYAIIIRRLNDVPAPEWVGKVYIGCWLVGSIMMLIYTLGVVYYVEFFEGFIYGFGISNFANLMGIIYIVEAVVGIIGLYYFIKDSNPDIDPMYGPSPKYTL